MRRRWTGDNRSLEGWVGHAERSPPSPDRTNPPPYLGGDALRGARSADRNLRLRLHRRHAVHQRRHADHVHRPTVAGHHRLVEQADRVGPAPLREPADPRRRATASAVPVEPRHARLDRVLPHRRNRLAGSALPTAQAPPGHRQRHGRGRLPRLRPRPSTTRRRRCGASNATCTTEHRLGWSQSR